jgi:hypothetical protein
MSIRKPKKGTKTMGVIHPNPETGLYYKPNKGYTWYNANHAVRKINEKEKREVMV